MKETSPAPKPAPAGQLPVTEGQEELSKVDKWLDSMRPYWSMIGIAAALAFLVFVALTWFVKSRQTQNEQQWMQLNRSLAGVAVTGKTDALLDVADEFPDGKAGLWALQIAGDADMRNGLGLITDPNKRPDGLKEGIKLLEKSVRALQQIVDAPAAQKSAMLQQRSTFSLAYALESLGKFEDAKKYYQEIVDTAPDSPFGSPAKRGLERASNPEYATLYEKFTNWEDTLGAAPGPAIEEPSDISFPEINLDGDKTGGGGDFGSKEEKADTEKADTEKADTEKADAEEADTEEGKADAEKTDEAKPAENGKQNEAESQEAEMKEADSAGDGETTEADAKAAAAAAEAEEAETETAAEAEAEKDETEDSEDK